MASGHAGVGDLPYKSFGGLYLLNRGGRHGNLPKRVL
jgi:hypothetical protein